MRRPARAHLSSTEGADRQRKPLHRQPLRSGAGGAFHRQVPGGREKEYSEIIAECHKALKHIEWEYERREFNFEEVEELEGDVDKIKRWQAEVVKRDFWEAAMRGDVEERIKEVEEKIAVFTQKTYEETARLPGEDAGPDGNPPVARSGGVRSTRPIAPGPL